MGNARDGELEEREALLAEAERIVGMGSWFWDVATNQVRWSDQLFHILGYPHDHPPSAEAFFARIHPEDLVRIREQSERTAAGGNPEPASCRLLLPDGVVRYVTLTGAVVRDPSGVVRRIVGTLLDVTDAHRVQAALETTTSQLLDAQRLAHLGSWRWLFAEDRFQLSEETFRLLGWPITRPPTVRDLVTLASRDDRARMERVLDQTRRGEQAPPIDLTLTCPDNIVRRFEASMRPVRDDHGVVVGAWGTLLDITERWNLQEQFLQAQKLEVVGQLAAGIAHDFNNLLTVIILATEVMAQGKGHPGARDVFDAAARAKALTQRLLAFGRHGVAQPHLTNLVDSTRGTIALLERLLGEHLELSCELPEEGVHVVVDETQFHQVLMNLLINARDAMPAGGQIRVSVARRHIGLGDAPHASPPLAAGDYAVVEVEDHGSGMDESTRARAFEPFFTTKPVGTGSGLGLATVRSIVNQAHGAIDLWSELGRGSRFRVYFPIGALPAVRARPELVKVQATTSARILLVEDEAIVANAMHGTLTRAGYAVTELRRPSEALGSSSTDSFDLLITDLVMPEMSGADLVRELRHRGTVPRVLFTTGYAPDAVLRSLGPDAVVLTKPFGAGALLEAVERLLQAPAAP